VSDPYNLHRFVEAQAGVFDTALAELKLGSKQTHWMWFIFPQLAGLGRSSTARYYGMGSEDEARGYLQHALLGSRLRQSVEAVLPWAGKRNAERIFGSIDALKMQSSMTLFDVIDPGGPFAKLLDDFYGGGRDERTLALLNGEE